MSGGLQMMRPGVWRARQKIDRLRVLRVAHIDDGDAVGKAVADIGKALIDHDLHAITAAMLTILPLKALLPKGISNSLWLRLAVQRIQCSACFGHPRLGSEKPPMS